MLKNSPVVPTFTNLNPSKCYSVTKTLSKCEQIFGNKQPELLQRLRSEEKEYALQTLGMTISFLEDALIAQKTLSTGQFLHYEPESGNEIETLEYMVLDSQCLQHLEIIESAAGTKEGSLFNYLDHCKTPFGKR
jgi:DNA mismatch repair ATPase MutS